MTPQKPQEHMQSTLNTVKAIIAVSSCKGGVGKSTIAAHLAAALARQGKRVGLLDADIHGPSIPTLFNDKNPPVTQNAHKQFIPIEKDGLKIMSFGFLLGDAPAVMRGPIVTQYVQQILHNTAWGDLDCLFVDMPPGTGDIQLTITQTARLSGAVIVTTPQTLSLIDVSRGILMFEKVNVPILGVIENMSYFICDECHKKHPVFGTHGHHTLTERFGVRCLAQVPLAQELSRIDAPSAHKIFDEAVQAVMQSLADQKRTQRTLTTLKYDADKITLGWSDGEKINVPNRLLRLNCACALCVNEITGERMLKETDIRGDIAPTEVYPLGNYAIGITWNDRHSSGIYPYQLIEKLAQTAKL